MYWASNITTYEIVMYAAKWRMKMSIKVQRNEMCVCKRMCVRKYKEIHIRSGINIEAYLVVFRIKIIRKCIGQLVFATGHLNY